MIEKKFNVFYIGAFRFPNEDAASKRVLSIGQVLNDIGHNVTFLSGEQGDCSEKKYKGFSYFSQNELDHKAVSLYAKLCFFFNSGKNTIKWLVKHNEEVDKIIIYNSNYIFFRRVSNFCKKYNKELIVDCTEWYDGSHLPGGRFGIISIDNFIKMYFGFSRVKKMIVISSYLEFFFKSKGVHTVRIPPLNAFVHKNITFKDESSVIRLIYAGSPGQKDDLISILQALNCDIFDNRFRITIFGVDSSFVPREYLKDNVFFKGRVSHDEVINEYEHSDFSFLIRPNLRYANAGFSTKFVESNFYGIPVITTETSDLKDYIINGLNGFIMPCDNVVENIKNVLLSIYNMNNIEIQKMKSQAYKLSTKFDQVNYIEVLKKIIN